MHIDGERLKWLEQLIVGLRLYHTLPSEFNDPFECKPHWAWPGTASSKRYIRKEFTRIALRNGKSRREAENFASEMMRDQKKSRKLIVDSAVKHYQKVRICCFSESKSSLLLWSHYANGHRGVCLGFRTDSHPIATCLKVHYQDAYPTLEYPLFENARGFRPVLIKSKDWQYEAEYRSLMYGNDTETRTDPRLGDRESLFLEPSTISDIFLGSEISDIHRTQVLGLIENSRINPRVWQCRISEDSYLLEFDEL